MTALALVPRSTNRFKKIRDVDLIPLDSQAFRFKRDSSVQEGPDIHGHNGSATKARNQAIEATVDSVIDNPVQTRHQVILALGEASTDHMPGHSSRVLD